MLEWLLELVHLATLDTLIGKRHRVAAYIIIGFLLAAGIILLMAYWAGPRDEFAALIIGVGALVLGLIVLLFTRSSYKREKPRVNVD